MAAFSGILESFTSGPTIISMVLESLPMIPLSFPDFTSLYTLILLAFEYASIISILRYDSDCTFKSCWHCSGDKVLHSSFQTVIPKVHLVLI